MAIEEDNDNEEELKIPEGYKNLEIVFQSWDKNEDAYKSYLSDMPWVADAFKDGKKHNQTFDVKGIPCLVVLNKDGTTAATLTGRGDVSSLNELAFEKWLKLVNK